MAFRECARSGLDVGGEVVGLLEVLRGPDWQVPELKVPLAFVEAVARLDGQDVVWHQAGKSAGRVMVVPILTSGPRST